MIKGQKKKEKKDRDSHEGGRKGGVGGVVITPRFTRETRAGRGECLAVAPGYLEEGLLHSEAGQQN